MLQKKRDPPIQTIVWKKIGLIVSDRYSAREVNIREEIIIKGFVKWYPLTFKTVSSSTKIPLKVLPYKL